MKVVVTGASGFLGSWICRMLSTDQDVYALMRQDSDAFRLTDIERLTKLHNDPLSWPSVIKEIEPEVIVACHWSGVRNQDRNNVNQFENVKVMTEIAKYAADSKIHAFIGLGSQAELGPVSGPISENATDNPTTEYGKAKVEVRSELEAIFLNSSTRFAWARIFSTYGPLDSDTWLIPSVILGLLRNEDVALTAGTQEWSFLHAVDAAYAIETIIKTDSINGIVHVGNPKTQSIRSAVISVATQLDKLSLLRFGAIPFRDDQVVSLMPMCKKLESAGWTPQIEFEEGVSGLISWIRGGNNFSWTDNQMNLRSVVIPTRLQIL